MELRNLSDKIYQSHVLETIKPHQKDSHLKGINTREYRAADKGNRWKFKLINTIDMTLEQITTKSNFIINMERMGYGVNWEDCYKYGENSDNQYISQIRTFHQFLTPANSSDYVLY